MDKEKTIKIQKFTDLTVWQKAHRLVLFIYRLTKEFPKTEIYALVDQMRRAAISITSNIAEGFGRRSYKEKVQFYFQANGSLIELENQILIARDIGYFKPTDELLALCNDVHKLLQGLIKSSRQKV